MRVTNDAGTALAVNRYDEFGIPAAGNMGRFQYTGQMWMPELGLYYYKARMYSPTLGRFLQTDPIGYGDGLNWYDYVGGDPVNATDPSGLALFKGTWKCPKGYDYGVPGSCRRPGSSSFYNDTYTVIGHGKSFPATLDCGGKGVPGGGFGMCNDGKPLGPTSGAPDGGQAWPTTPAAVPQNNQDRCSPNGYFKAMGSDGKPICWPTPNTPPSKPEPPKKPSRLEQCLTKAAEDYANGDVHLEDGPKSWAGGARTSLGNPFRKDGMLTPGPTALGFLSNLGRAIGYHIGISCR